MLCWHKLTHVRTYHVLRILVDTFPLHAAVLLQTQQKTHETSHNSILFLFIVVRPLSCIYAMNHSIKHTVSGLRSTTYVYCITSTKRISSQVYTEVYNVQLYTGGC